MDQGQETYEVRTVTAHIAVPKDWTAQQVQELINSFTRVARPQGVEIYSHAFAPVWGQSA